MTRYYKTRSGRTVEERDDNFHETLAPASHYYAPVETEPARLVGERSRTISGLELFVGWVAGIISALLAMRFVFSLLNANQVNGFVSFVYNVTDGLVKPFANVFNYSVNTGVGYFDLPALMAIAVVALVAWAITRLLRIGRA